MYCVFGSRYLHSPHIQFHEKCHIFNGGKAVNLIRATETRMDGFSYDFHKSLRIYQYLEYTVGTPKWLALKKNPIMTRDEKDTKENMYRKKLYALLSEIWPVLKLPQIDY